MGARCRPTGPTRHGPARLAAGAVDERSTVSRRPRCGGSGRQGALAESTPGLWRQPATAAARRGTRRRNTAAPIERTRAIDSAVDGPWADAPTVRVALRLATQQAAAWLTGPGCELRSRIRPKHREKKASCGSVHLPFRSGPLFFFAGGAAAAGATGAFFGFGAFFSSAGSAELSALARVSTAACNMAGCMHAKNAMPCSGVMVVGT